MADGWDLRRRGDLGYPSQEAPRISENDKALPTAKNRYYSHEITLPLRSKYRRQLETHTRAEGARDCGHLRKGKYQHFNRGKRNADYDHVVLRPGGVGIHQHKRILGSAAELQERECADAVRKAARLPKGQKRRSGNRSRRGGNRQRNIPLLSRRNEHESDRRQAERKGLDHKRKRIALPKSGNSANIDERKIYGRRASSKDVCD